jgi:hypothetical protein
MKIFSNTPVQQIKGCLTLVCFWSFESEEEQSEYKIEKRVCRYHMIEKLKPTGKSFVCKMLKRKLRTPSSFRSPQNS